MSVMAASSAVSPPATPEATRRPQSMISPPSVSPDAVQPKSRPQSMMMTGQPRARSRFSVASSRGQDEDGKTAVKVGKLKQTLGDLYIGA